MSCSLIVTSGMIKACMPKCNSADLVSKVLTLELAKSDINTKLRVAAFISQCGHESLDFNRLEEGLNYSTSRLRQVFPKYFPSDTMASTYANRPDAIANKVYANRMGNGSEQSGDGYKYRGRGVIMLTGREMYTRYADYSGTGKKLIQSPELLTSMDHAIKSAIWFWSVHKNLSKFADKSDIVTITKYINGGDHGLEDRIYRYKKALIALG